MSLPLTDSAAGYLLTAGEGQASWFLDTRMTIKAGAEQTHGAFTFIEWQAPAGFGPPRHIHDRDDEAFYILEGSMTLECGQSTWEAGPGDFVLLPRGAAHAFVVISDVIRGLQITAPSGFEQLIAAVGRAPEHEGLPAVSMPDIAAVAAAWAAVGVRIVGPPMADPGADAPTVT